MNSLLSEQESFHISLKESGISITKLKIYKGLLIIKMGPTVKEIHLINKAHLFHFL